MDVIYAHRKYWKNLQLQETYSIEELNNVNPQPNLHKIPFDSFIGGDPLPERFETRNCYPVQSDETKKRLADELMSLKFFTKLEFPIDSRVCYVYDEAMMEHKNIYEE
jgi:histone deacetylase 6